MYYSMQMVAPKHIGDHKPKPKKIVIFSSAPLPTPKETYLYLFEWTSYLIFFINSHKGPSVKTSNILLWPLRRTFHPSLSTSSIINVYVNLEIVLNERQNCLTIEYLHYMLDSIKQQNLTTSILAIKELKHTLQI